MDRAKTPPVSEPFLCNDADIIALDNVLQNCFVKLMGIVVLLTCTQKCGNPVNKLGIRLLIGDMACWVLCVLT